MWLSIRTTLPFQPVGRGAVVMSGSKVEDEINNQIYSHISEQDLKFYYQIKLI